LTLIHLSAPDGFSRLMTRLSNGVSRMGKRISKRLNVLATFCRAGFGKPLLPASLVFASGPAPRSPCPATRDALLGPRLNPELECLVPEPLLSRREHKLLPAVLATQLGINKCEVRVVITPRLHSRVSLQCPPRLEAGDACPPQIVCARIINGPSRWAVDRESPCRAPIGLPLKESRLGDGTWLATDRARQ
jgi:hypothetical protein